MEGERKEENRGIGDEKGMTKWWTKKRNRDAEERKG